MPRREGNRRLAAYGLLIASLLVGASAPPFYKLADTLPPIQLSFWIALVGTVCSSVILCLMPGTDPFRVYLRDRSQLGILLAWGFGSFTVLVLALSAGTHVLSASLTAVVYRTWPLMLGVLVWPVLGHRLGVRDWFGLGLGFLGVLAAYALAGTVLFPGPDLPFVALLLAGAFGDALAAAFSRRYRPSNMASFVFGCNAISLACFAALGGAAGVLAPHSISPQVLVAILFLGGVQNVGLTVLFIVSYDWVSDTGPVALVYLASPFVTFVLDELFLHEPILPAYWWIAAGVLGGALAMNVGRGRARAGTRPIP